MGPANESQSVLERQVEYRAGSRCEYCRMHQGLQGASFHLEHVIPKSRGGKTELDNLAQERYQETESVLRAARDVMELKTVKW